MYPNNIDFENDSKSRMIIEGYFSFNSLLTSFGRYRVQVLFTFHSEITRLIHVSLIRSTFFSFLLFETLSSSSPVGLCFHFWSMS